MDNVWLIKTAKLMREYADGHPWTPGVRIANYRRLTVDGLVIEFYFDARSEDYTLALAREGAAPAEDECKTVLAEFGSPLLLTRHQPERVSEQLHILKFQWKKQFAVTAPAKPAGHARRHRVEA